MLIEKAKSRTCLTIIAVVLICMTEYASLAITIPHKISYQGKLIENGVPVTGTKTINFSFIDTDWEETHKNVNILNGMYSVVLGSMIPIPVTVFGQDEVRLRIIVNGIELKPDVGIFSVGRSFVSLTSEYAERAGVAEKLSGNIIHVNSNKNVGVGTDSPKEKLEVNGGIRIGYTDSKNLGTIRRNGNNLEFFDGMKWKSLTIQQNNSIQVIAGENIESSDKPVPVFLSKDGVILSQTNKADAVEIFGLNRYGQIFSTDAGTHDINAISIYLEIKNTFNEDIILSFHELDVGNVPTMKPMISTNISYDKIISGWNKITFNSPINVEPSKKYAIILNSQNATSDNHVLWFYSDSDKILGGHYISCSNYLNEWTNDTEKDFMFKIHSENRAFISDNVNSNPNNILGFVSIDASPGDKISVQTDGIISGLSGLVAGHDYYLQDDGTIGNLPGSNVQYIGVAVSESEILLKNQISWIQDKNGIFFNTGNVRIGTNDVGAKLHIKNVDKNKPALLIQNERNLSSKNVQLISSNMDFEPIASDKTSDDGWIIAGYTSSSETSSDIVIMKFSETGNVDWIKVINGEKQDNCYDIKSTIDNCFIMVGRTNSFTLDKDEVFLVKLDAKGNLLWAKTFNNTAFQAFTIHETSEGKYLLSGNRIVIVGQNGEIIDWQKYLKKSTIRDSVMLNNNDVLMVSSQYVDEKNQMFFSKFEIDDPDKGLRMVKTIKFEQLVSTPYYVESTSDDGWIFAGKIQQMQEDNKYHYNILLIKMNKYGTIDWSKTYGGDGIDYVFDIQNTNDNGWLVAGSTQSYGFGKEDILLIKVDEDGEMQWAKVIGSENDDAAKVIQKKSNGDLLIACEYDYKNLLLIHADSNGNFSENCSFREVHPNTASLSLSTTDTEIGYMDTNYILQDQVPDMISISESLSNNIVMCDSNESIDETNHLKDDFIVTQKGYVGIGTNKPMYNLHVNGFIYSIDSYKSSDKKFKKNIHTIENALELINQLRGVTFDWRVKEFPEMNLNNKRQVGFIAQEFEEFLPELVQTTEMGKSITYEKVTPVLVEGIKALSKQLKELENKISLQDEIIQYQKSIIENHENQLNELRELIERIPQIPES